MGIGIGSNQPPRGAGPARAADDLTPATTASTSAPAPAAQGWTPKAAPAAAPAAPVEVGEVRGAQQWLKVQGSVSFTLNGDGKTGSAHVEIPLSALPDGANGVQSVRSAPPWGGTDAKASVAGGVLSVDLSGATLVGWQQAAGHLEVNLPGDKRFFLTVKPSGPIHTDDTAVRMAELQSVADASTKRIAQSQQQLEQYRAKLTEPVPSATWVAEAKARVVTKGQELEAARAKTAERAQVQREDPDGVFMLARDVRELSSDVQKYVALGKQRGAVAAQLEPIADLSDAGLGGDPALVAKLRAQQADLVAQQKATAEGMRARILSEPALLAQVNPAGVPSAEGALARARNEVAQAELTLKQDLDNRAGRVGADITQAEADLAAFTQKRDEALKGLAARAQSFTDVPVR
jgi:hypothetical protein